MRPACRRIRAMSAGSVPRVEDRRRLRPAAAHRVLQRPFEHHLHEQQHDEIEQQRRHHLVDAELARAAASARASAARRRARRRAAPAGPGRTTAPSMAPAADRDGGERARIELALAADVVEPRAERDRGGKAGEDQRRRARQRLGEANSEPAAPCAIRPKARTSGAPAKASGMAASASAAATAASRRAEPQRERRARRAARSGSCRPPRGRPSSGRAAPG